MATHTKPWLARLRALRPRPGFLAQTLARRRSAVAVLLLSVWLLPAFVPGRPAAPPLPDCCRGDGAHKCFLSLAMKAAGAPVTAVTVHCDAPLPKAIASANL